MQKLNKNGVIGILDVGSSKIICLIARQQGDGSLKVIGSGHQASFGLRAGSIANMDAAESAIGAAVQAAEQMAGETLREVLVNLSGGQPATATIEVKVATHGQPIGAPALRRVAQHCKAALGEIEGAPLHMIPTSYALDGNRGIRDPRGMVGNQLGVQMTAVTANAAALRTLTATINRCHLDVQQVVLSPLATARACLSADELELGATVIDMGGGVTSIGVFSEGELVFADAVPMGGSHVTNDIARGLITPVVHAERLKVLYGHARVSTTDRHELLEVPQLGESEQAQVVPVQRSLLTGIIQPRVSEILEMVRARLEHSGFYELGGRRVVLTGGASQLAGLQALAQDILEKQVRIGKPLQLAGLPESFANPAFSTALGLLAYATSANTEFRIVGNTSSGRGLLARIGEWFRENA